MKHVIVKTIKPKNLYLVCYDSTKFSIYEKGKKYKIYTIVRYITFNDKWKMVHCHNVAQIYINGRVSIEIAMDSKKQMHGLYISKSLLIENKFVYYK
jgi:hypothetical protein